MTTSTILRNTLLLFFLLTVYSRVSSQSDPEWEVLNPSPSLMAGNEICFIDELNGFIVTESELLRTQNGGDSWENEMELTSGKDLAFANSIGYIVGAGGAIYKSTLNGEEWNKLTVAFSFDLNSVSVIHPDTVRIAGDNHLIISNDGGLNWDIHPVQGVDIEASYFTSPDTGHVACKDGTILKTVDAGLNWYTTEQADHTPSDFFDICFVNANLGFSSRAHSDLLRTTDGGETWEELAVYLEAAYDIFFIDPSTAYLAGASGTMFKTIDGGTTWENAGFESLIDGMDLYGLYFQDANTGFAVGQRGRILRTTDGAVTWDKYAPTYYEIHQVAQTSQQDLYALGEKLYKSTDGGQHWDTLNTGIYDYDRFVYMYKEGQFFSSEEFYVIASAGEVSHVIKSTDGGQSFEIVKDVDKAIRATSMHFLDMQTGFVCNSYSSFWSGLHKTSDGGQTWLDVSSNRFRDIYFVSEDVGFGIMADQLHQTSDGGYTWELILDINIDFNEITFANDTVGYISGDDGLVLKTTDQGENWHESYTGYDDNFGICFKDPYTGFVTGEYNTLYYTIDGGSNWDTWILPVTVKSVSVSDGRELYLSGKNGVILKNTSELNKVNIGQLEAEQTAGNLIEVQAIIYPGGHTLSPVYFDYGVNGIFTDSKLAQPQNLDSYISQLVKAELTGLDRDIEYSLRVRATGSESDYYSDTITFINQTISSSRDFQQLPQIHIFPNPAKDILHIESPEPIESIEVFDINGKIVMNSTFQPQVDISMLKPGQYYIRVHYKEQSATGQFLKE
jgi:photosystem II stability/assembly factor-like uncharacterized protein